MIFAPSGSGLYRVVRGPAFGGQDIGRSPGGAHDRFSLYTGNLLLGNPGDRPALEIILPPPLECLKEGLFVLTGAAPARAFLEFRTGGGREVRHGVTAAAGAGDRLHLSQDRRYGFRTYLCSKPLGRARARRLEGRERGPFGRIATWADPDGFIRIVRGPEAGLLRDWKDLTAAAWKVSSDSSGMGLRLTGRNPALAKDAGEMASSPVCDGTIQLTPGGPVVLLRERQTVGGYPRAGCVISADMDRLAQLAPGQVFRFREASLREARAASLRWREDLKKIGSSGIP